MWPQWAECLHWVSPVPHFLQLVQSGCRFGSGPEASRCFGMGVVLDRQILEHALFRQQVCIPFESLIGELHVKRYERAPSALPTLARLVQLRQIKRGSAEL